ncbi:amidohydrolase family protein [Nakamurella sp. YIM 132087]|uniref:Amidohydrolase family protein n=1 Tax=Nakamurella alba TaxID=2665158 RepID=A0A7K1FIV1_9ACTN|nr:amidohydrolase family protein [Nakamurella alba]MTD13379.1 amidohydrolase family protein [Nakamurella alba]
MTETPVIDSHHHVWDLAARDQPWTADLPLLRRTYHYSDLAPALDVNGVTGTVLVQTVPDPDETPEMLAAAAANPRIAGVVGWVDLTAPDVSHRLDALREAPGAEKLVGIRHLVSNEPDPEWLCRPDVRRGLQAVADAGLVYDLLVWHHQLPAVVETVQAMEDLRFVLDHGGKPAIREGLQEPWAGHIAAIAATERCAAKLSGLAVEAAPGWTADDLRPWTDHLLDAFGPSRTMYGSDWPVCLLAGTYQDMWNATALALASLSAGERSAVLGTVAHDWYQI